MDIHLKELKRLQGNLDKVIDERKNKLKSLCHKLREECDKELKDFFHKAFNNKYEWDGHKVWITGEENPFAEFRIFWETDWDSPTYTQYIKFELEGYGFRRIDPTNCENKENILRHLRGTEELFFMMSQGHLDNLKEIENTYKDIINKTKKHHETKGGLKELLEKEKELTRMYANRLDELFVEGFEFNVKGSYHRYRQEYTNLICVGGEKHFDIVKIRIDKVTPKQIVYTLITEHNTEYQYRRTKDKVERELKNLYQHFFIDHKAEHLKELEEKES